MPDEAKEKREARLFSTFGACKTGLVCRKSFCPGFPFFIACQAQRQGSCSGTRPQGRDLRELESTGSMDRMIICHTETMEKLRQRTAVCLGYFDGVHRGHLALLKEAQAIARREGLTVAVHTFDVPPASVLRPDQPVEQLTSPSEKAAIFAANGCEILAVSVFDERMRAMPGKVFFEEILLGRLNARAVITGDDHRFGFRGDTGVRELSALCQSAGVLLSVVPRVKLPDGTVISSSAIRQALRQGDLSRAEEMLGRPVQDMWKSQER